ncbi:MULTISPECIES: Gfo/Idh/MocA family oxidoreductase [Microbacterium]|uniref:Gfo/Idh/MocA family oxidoreductase n=1 Tax=Microbacterium TaxID=33882 RepID=UPI000C2C8B2E|nr:MULTISPECIES: Gfo/Idh/MocA family oxidoreductase [Microbacterium]
MNRLRIGVIGLGMVGSEQVATIARSVALGELVAVSDFDLDRAHAIAEGLPGDVRVARSAEELIASDDVDAVAIASSAASHLSLVLACIEHRKPVFCEKPLALTGADCELIIDAEIAAGRRFVQVGFMRRFDTAFVELKAAVETGDLGEIVALQYVHRAADVPEYFTSAMHTTEAVVHEVDTTRWLADDEIAEVSVTGTGGRSGLDEWLDPQFFSFRTERGAMVYAEVFLRAGYGYEIGCDVVGRQGVARLTNAPVTAVSLDFRTSGVREKDFTVRFGDAYRRELTAWAEDALHGVVTGPNAWDGYAAAAATDACIEALRTGSPTVVKMRERPALYGQGPSRAT